MKEKVDAGCSFLTTQMFFDNALLYQLLDTIRAAGIGVPVVAGIMPITAASQIHRAIALSELVKEVENDERQTNMAMPPLP